LIIHIFFSKQNDLHQHELNHNASQVACHLCNKIFANIYRLQRHMLSHEVDPQTRKFKCSHCSKAFKFKHHLKVILTKNITIIYL
jgi:hypothetical protein